MESRPPPDLNDPAYRRELRGVAWVPGYAGVALTVIGMALLVARSRHVLAVHVLVPILIVVAAIVLTSVAMLKRSRHHARRMRGG